MIKRFLLFLFLFYSICPLLTATNVSSTLYAFYGDSIPVNKDSIELQDAYTLSKSVKKLKKKKKSVDQMLKHLNSIDTNYIHPCLYNYTAMLQNTNSMQQYRFSGKDENGNRQTLKFDSNPSLKIGPYFGWRWIFFGYTFNINTLSRRVKKNTEFNLSIYSAKIGVDLVYQRNKNDFKLTSIKGFDHLSDKSHITGTDFDGLRTSITGINIYYIFNHRKFSYPAAFSQTTEQRRSAGSWKVGFQYIHQNIHFDYTKLPEEMISTEDGKTGVIEQLKFRNINYSDYSLSGGYAYNWVFLPHCLLCGSLSPAIGYKHTKGEVPEKKFSYYINNLNFDLITRIGLVWNNSKFFAGSSFVLHSYTYEKDKFSITNWRSYLNIYIGLYFGRRKIYKTYGYRKK